MTTIQRSVVAILGILLLLGAIFALAQNTINDTDNRVEELRQDLIR